MNKDNPCNTCPDEETCENICDKLKEWRLAAEPEAGPVPNRKPDGYGRKKFNEPTVYGGRFTEALGYPDDCKFG